MLLLFFCFVVSNENVEIGQSYAICVEELQVAAGIKGSWN